MEKISQSTVVIYEFDVVESKPEDLWEDVDRFLEGSEALTEGNKPLFVANKMDLNLYTKPESYYKEGLISRDSLITASALNKMNIESLKNLLYQMAIENPELMDQRIVSNSRHYDALH